MTRKDYTKPGRKDKALMNELQETVKHIPTQDGWTNLLTGLGHNNRDRRMSNVAAYGMPLIETVVEELFAADPTARRIVEILPNDAMREGIKFEDETIGKAFEEELERLQGMPRAQDGWWKARLYGGGGIFVNDNTPVEKLYKPLNMDNLGKIVSLTTLSRWELVTWATDIYRDISHPNYGQPFQYHIVPRMSFGQVMVNVHASRIIRFDGKKLPTLLNIRNNFWGDSVLTPLYEILGDYKTGNASIANILQDFRLLVHSIEGLAQMIAAGQEGQIRKRLEIMAAAKSIIGAVAIDSKDKMEYFSSTLTGVAELVQQVGKRLQAETDIPHTILFNESPSGLGATGNHEEKNWYNTVKAQQVNYLKPRLDQLLKLIYCQRIGPFKGQEPKNWNYDFEPLWQLDDKDQAELNYHNSQAYDLDITNGLILPEEARQKKYPELPQDVKITPPAEPTNEKPPQA